MNSEMAYSVQSSPLSQERLLRWPVQHKIKVPAVFSRETLITLLHHA